MYIGVKCGSKIKGLIRNGLVAEYRFDEGTGQVLKDWAGSNNGQLGSAAGTDASDPTWSGQGLSYDATDDNVIVNHNSSLELSQMSYVVVYKASGLGGSSLGRLIDKNNFLIRVGTTNALQFDCVAGTTGTWRVDNMFILNQWNLAIITYDRTNINNDPIFYKYGIPISISAKTAPTGSPYATNANPLCIGNRYTPDRSFQGIIGTVLIYNRILTPAECLNIYKYHKSKLAPKGIAI